jgi:2-polyprenyl-3-methyl-5-hydroxy-6-metoxy-1,4-benzoquinol methylase
MKLDHTPIRQCLACGGADLVPTLDLGRQPLANNFKSTPDTDGEPTYPLAINRCDNCNHLQLTHAVDPEIIYTHYLYVSGTSGTYLDYMDWYARFVTEQFSDKYVVKCVLDIGCNDGSQLDAFRTLGYSTFGVDPAENLYATSSQKGHTVWCAFWDKELAKHINNKFDVITTQNAFAHIPDPLTYLQLARDRLADTGRIFISTSQADMVLNGEFDTIYHEHISYYNAASMKALAERAGLHLIDVVKTPIHGTSYVFILGHHPENQERIANIIAMESAPGLNRAETYTTWAHGVEKLIKDLKEQIAVYQAWGYHVIGYGAAAKGMTLINASKITLDAVIDDNPLKQGTYCPGTTIPVVSSDYIRSIPAKDKIVFVPLAWNFYTEITRKIRDIRNNEKDLFLRYFPTISTE